MRKPYLLAATLLAALVLLPGCGILDVGMLYFGRLVSPPPKTKPSFSLAGKSVLILVDPAGLTLAERYPNLKIDVTTALAQELDSQKAAASIVNPRDIMNFAQGRANYAQLSIIEIGRQFKVDQVLQIVVYDYGMEKALAGDNYNGFISVGLRVIDVGRGCQVYPAGDGDQLLEVRSPSGIMVEDLPAARAALMEGLALKVGQIFVAYEIDKLPMRREVR